MEKYSLSDQALALWLNYIEHQVGFVLPAMQHTWIKGIIERHMVRTQLDSMALLQAIVQDGALYHQLIDDILIPRTQFFRHIPTFEFVEAFAQAWYHQHSSQQQFCAWSVGCATGQEAVTMALCLEQALPSDQAYQVFGSDFHQSALAEATLGEYDNAQQAFIPTQFHHYLDRIGEHKFSLIPRIKSQLQFFSQNLVDHRQALPMATGQCQLIVCKNVLMYFRQFEQRDIVRFLTRYLADDGILLLGAGEDVGFSDLMLQKIKIPTINGYCQPLAPTWLKTLANIA